MNGNEEALARLGANARAFGSAYAALKDAMVKSGIREDEAREEARNAATVAALYEDESEEACPLCGQ